MVVALTFISINDIDLTIELLSKHLSDKLRFLLNWFEDNYVRRIHLNSNRIRLP